MSRQHIASFRAYEAWSSQDAGEYDKSAVYDDRTDLLRDVSEALDQGRSVLIEPTTMTNEEYAACGEELQGNPLI